jgi:hypothetical protein
VHHLWTIKRPISLGMEDSKTLKFNFEKLRKTVQTMVIHKVNIDTIKII